jgi:hypothetical protein
VADICKNGHINPPRRKNRNCIICEGERYKKDRRYRENVKRATQKRREAIKNDPQKAKEHRDYQREYKRKNAEKLNARSRELYASRPKKRIETRLRKLRIEPTEELVEALLEHSGKCDICGNPGDGRWGELAIDHCHEKNFVRGMLCSSCNRAIGLFKDSPSLLQTAITYLIQARKLIPNERHRG